MFNVSWHVVIAKCNILNKSGIQTKKTKIQANLAKKHPQNTNDPSSSLSKKNVVITDNPYK